MRIIFVYICFLFSCVGNTAYSQCLQNSDFSQLTCTYNVCPTISYGCVPNWYVSHGSPQVFGTSGDASNYALMWSNGASEGEGMFANYEFVANRQYIITMRVSSFASHDESGVFKLFAANNLVDQAPHYCGGGSSIPINNTKELIIEQNFASNQSWTVFTYTFTPTANFSQFWMYPQLTLGNYQYIWYVDYVSICPDPCSSVYFNNGTVPPGDLKYSQIFAGSSAGSGGSGTVTVSNVATTNLIAAQKIELLPDFEATVTSGSFSASIANNCDSSIGDRKILLPGRQNDKYPIVDHKSAELDLLISNTNRNPLANEVSVYPIPSKGAVTVKSGSPDGSNAIFSVTDLSGKEVFNTYNKTNSSSSNLDLSKLPNGIYFLNIKTADGISATLKFIKE